ncbi:MAG: hypothetical protein ACYTG5_07180 [Planctomycetota bacterium]|jgi:hypothetical protein
MGGKRRAAGKLHKSARARAGSRSPRAGAEAEVFPWLLCLGCLFGGLYLFLSSTVPALRERKDLIHKDKVYLQALEETRRMTEELRIRRDELSKNPEALLVEVDDLGMTMDAALSRFGPDDQKKPR